MITWSPMHDTVRHVCELLYAGVAMLVHVTGRALLLGLGLFIMLMWIIMVLLLTGRLPYALRRYL